jgi:DNA-binding CsgD family transcriptional regulator/GAF domain-containing protein
VPGTSATVDFPRGEQILASVTDAVMKMFDESLAVQSKIDTDAILATVTRTIAQHLPVTCSAILMKSDPDKSRVVFADVSSPAMAHYLDDYVTTLLRPGEAPTTGLSRRVIETGRSVFFQRLSMDQLRSMVTEAGQRYQAEHPMPINSDSVGLLMVPMRSGPAIVGTLALFDWLAADVLTESDIEWMQRAADRIGLTIDSAQLRNKAMDRAERISALSDAALAITAGQDVRLTLKLILERVIATLRVEAADVLLVDESDNALVVAASSGFRSTSTFDLRFQISPEVAKRWVVEHNVGSPSAMDWIGQSRRWMAAREGLKSYTAAPLIVREKFVGALEVFSRGALEPDPEWLDFLDTMGSQAAIAVDNAAMRDALGRGGQGPHLPRIPSPTFSERERQILKLVVDGASNREVAEKLHLSENTIKFHIRQLLEKADVANRTELATRAMHEGWL